MHLRTRSPITTEKIPVTPVRRELILYTFFIVYSIYIVNRVQNDMDGSRLGLLKTTVVGYIDYRVCI